MFQSARSSWLIRHYPRKEAKFRLFCFPYAGGSAAIFRDWARTMHESIEICAIEYPGRGSRRTIAPFTSIAALADALLPHLRRELAMPFAFFGHSMGALVAFEILKRLRLHPGVDAACFFASGCRPPWQPLHRRQMYHLPEAEFIEQLRALGGTPEELLADEELIRFLLPTLRADFEASETYCCEVGDGLLRCPIFAYGGLRDSDITHADLEAWGTACDRLCVRMFPGDHFFLHSAECNLAKVVAQDFLMRMAERERLA